MRFVEWEQPTRRFSQASITKFYEQPLAEPIAFRYKTRDLYMPEHGGAFSLKYVISGEEVYKIGKRRVVVAAGQALFIENGVRYASEISKNTESLSIFLPCNERQLAFFSVFKNHSQQLDSCAQSQAEPELPSVVFRIPVQAQKELARLTLSFSELDEKRRVDHARAAVVDAIISLKRGAPATSLLHVVKRSTREELLQRLLRAKTCIEDTYGVETSLDQLADIACLSKYHFLRLFREAYGETPAAYARRLRLTHAIESIQQGASELEAAQKAEYTDLRAFRRACARAAQTNQSPK